MPIPQFPCNREEKCPQLGEEEEDQLPAEFLGENELISYSRFSISHTTAPKTPIMEDSEEKKKKMKTGFEVAIPASTSSLISNSDSYLLTELLHMP